MVSIPLGAIPFKCITVYTDLKSFYKISLPVESGQCAYLKPQHQQQYHFATDSGRSLASLKGAPSASAKRF